MKKLGFTLVELLGVIVLMALILIIALPLITDSVRNHEDELNKLEEEVIINSTKLFIDDNSDEYIKKDGAIYCIPLTVLRDNEYLKDVTSSNIIKETTVKVTSKKDFVYELVDNKECEENFYPLKPNLHNHSLVPVVYKNSSWKVADENSNWYDYENQEWANAVILKIGVNKNVGDTINIETEVQGMFVWIPRYEYKIVGQYGIHSDGTPGTQELPGEIKVNFISTTKRETNNEYIIHPAFTFGNQILSGIWVGKFETTGTGNNPTVLPNSYSLRNQNVSTQFATSQKLNQFLSNGDSHMAKNSEWGAVAYLSQSKYGKYGNASYSGAEKQVRINNCSNYITGIGANSQNEAMTTSTCTTNTYETEKGQTASTTGNITGVYDMSGGAYEYVMGGLANAKGEPRSGYTVEYNSGFIDSVVTTGIPFPESKYYDLYLTVDEEKACNGDICYGHALTETSLWYNNFSRFIYSQGVWFERGGLDNVNSNLGIFSYQGGYGRGYNNNSFRIFIS